MRRLRPVLGAGAALPLPGAGREVSADDFRRFLVRQFGKSSALALDRDAENRIFARLSELGVAPPLIGTFDGGRIEGWLEGGPCTAPECRAPAVFEPVARALASLHGTPRNGTSRMGHERASAGVSATHG